MKIRVGFGSGKSDQLLRLNLHRLRKGVARSILTRTGLPAMLFSERKIPEKRLGTSVGTAP